MLTREEIERALPTTLKTSATQQLTDNINNITTDPLMAQNIRDNFISYTSIMKDGKFKIQDYINAVVYVSFKLMGNSNKEAYLKTFPQRHAQLLSNGATEKDISAYVSAYAKGKLPNLIMEQSLVPTWVLNQDIHQKAINVLADLMVNANSEKVQSDSASALLTHLKKPEVKEFQLSVETKDSSGMNEMKEALAKMAAQQQQMIAGGVPIKQITDSVIIENE